MVFDLLRELDSRDRKVFTGSLMSSQKKEKSAAPEATSLAIGATLRDCLARHGRTRVSLLCKQPAQYPNT